MFYPSYRHLSNNSGSDLSDFDLCDHIAEYKWIWLVGTLLCFLIGFPASVAVLLDVIKTRRKGCAISPHVFFLFNITIMDTVFMAFIPLGFLNYFWLHNETFDAIWNFVFALNLCGRPLTMACICLDCYLAVVHPITYRRRKSLAPRVFLMSLVWTVTIASGVAYAIDYKLFATMFPNVPYLIAVVIIGVCDFFIIYTLTTSDPSNNNIHPQKKRALHTVINSLVMTVIAYVAPLLINLIGIPNMSVENFVCILSIPATITTTLGSTVMPLLHLISLGKLECLMLGCCRDN